MKQKDSRVLRSPLVFSGYFFRYRSDVLLWCVCFAAILLETPFIGVNTGVFAEDALDEGLFQNTSAEQPPLLMQTTQLPSDDAVSLKSIVDEPELSPSPTLTLADVIQATLQNSFDLKIAQTEVKIGKTNIREAVADYFPEVTLQGNSEYNERLGKMASSPSAINSINGNILINNTLYQTSLGLRMNYTLLDFGVRGKKVQIASRDVSLKQKELESKRRDLVADTVDAYGETLLAFKQLQLREQLVQVARERFRMKQQLFDAGLISKVDVADAGYDSAQELESLDSARVRFQKSLTELSGRTQQRYDPGTTILAMISTTVPDLAQAEPRPEELPEYQRYTKEIEQKQLEADVILRERLLPAIRSYTNYNLYGSDADNTWGSIGNLAQRTFVVGLAVSLPLFDGFKSDAKRDRALLEAERLRLERDKAVNTFLTQYRVVRSETTSLATQRQSSTEALNQARQEEGYTARLVAQQIKEKSELLQQQVQSLKAKLESVSVQIKEQVAWKKLQFLQTGQY